MSTEIEAKSPRTSRWRSIGHQRTLGAATAHAWEHRHDGTRENLEIVSYWENATHARRVLGVAPQDGERNPHAKLSRADVDTIRAARGRESAIDLAALYGITWQHVYRLWAGERWSVEVRP